MKIKKCYLYIQDGSVKHATEQEVRTVGEKKYFERKGVENYALVPQTKKDIEEATSILFDNALPKGKTKNKKKSKKGNTDSFDINDRVKTPFEDRVKDNED